MSLSQLFSHIHAEKQTSAEHKPLIQGPDQVNICHKIEAFVPWANVQTYKNAEK